MTFLLCMITVSVATPPCQSAVVTVRLQQHHRVKFTYLLMLQEMLKMFTTGLDTLPTHPPQILAHML
jgi:hypothetical protein